MVPLRPGCRRRRRAVRLVIAVVGPSGRRRRSGEPVVLGLRDVDGHRETRKGQSKAAHAVRRCIGRDTIVDGQQQLGRTRNGVRVGRPRGEAEHGHVGAVGRLRCKPLDVAERGEQGLRRGTKPAVIGDANDLDGDAEAGGHRFGASHAAPGTEQETETGRAEVSGGDAGAVGPRAKAHEEVVGVVAMDGKGSRVQAMAHRDGVRDLLGRDSRAVARHGSQESALEGGFRSEHLRRAGEVANRAGWAQ